MTFEELQTIAEFLEENEEALTVFLNGDDAKAAVLISDFQTFVFDAEFADGLWSPTDTDDE